MWHQEDIHTALFSGFNQSLVRLPGKSDLFVEVWMCNQTLVQIKKVNSGLPTNLGFRDYSKSRKRTIPPGILGKFNPNKWKRIGLWHFTKDKTEILLPLLKSDTASFTKSVSIWWRRKLRSVSSSEIFVLFPSEVLDAAPLQVRRGTGCSKDLVGLTRCSVKENCTSWKSSNCCIFGPRSNRVYWFS